MAPNISNRGTKVPASPIRKLMPLADAARRRGTRVLQLNIGQPDLETPEPMRRKLALAPRIFAYTPSGGTSECIAALLAYYRQVGVELEAEDVLVTTGGSEAVQFVMTALADEGDEALLAEPFYTNYLSFSTMAGVRLVPLQTSVENGFHLPPVEVWERALTPRTRFVMLTNPNNPTGTVYTEQEIAGLAAFCKHHGLFFVVDEVYREFVYDGRRPGTTLSLPGLDDHLIVVDSLSKRFSACGIRLGCLITRNREVHGSCLRMAQGRLSAPGLAQMVAEGMAELGPEYFSGVAREFEARRNLLYQGLQGIPGVFLTKPEGAFYFVARLPVADAEDFARFLLEDFSHQGATVLVAPAPGFYATPGLGTDEVRIAYVLCQPDLAEAVGVLAAGLRAYAGPRQSALLTGTSSIHA
jgi:aspartate aminotransferase